MTGKTKTALVTGITGQDGSYLAELLLAKGYRVFGFEQRDRRKNRSHLQAILHRIHFIPGDLRDAGSIRTGIKRSQPDEIYNLASQSSATQSWRDPVYTGEVTGLGPVKILEAIRALNPRIRFFQASSAEMFDQSGGGALSERTPCAPRNPYGAAKLYAHWSVAHYRSGFGLFAVSGILFNHESPRRGPDFVTRKIVRTAAQIRLGLARELRLGNLHTRRDWGFAGDYVQAMWRMLHQKTPQDYVIATGKTHSVLEFVKETFGYLGLDWTQYVVVDPTLIRPGEEPHVWGNASRARKELGWRPTVGFRKLVRIMVDADLERVSGEVKRMRSRRRDLQT